MQPLDQWHRQWLEPVRNAVSQANYCGVGLQNPCFNKPSGDPDTHSKLGTAAQEDGRSLGQNDLSPWMEQRYGPSLKIEVNFCCAQPFEGYFGKQVLCPSQTLITTGLQV